MSAKSIPPGFRTITPHLICRNGKQAIEFYKEAFGAETLAAHFTPDGGLMHATLKIGDSTVMLGEECPEYGALSPLSVGNSTVVIHLYTEDVDRVFQKAISAGCTTTMPVEDQFWGDRYGQLSDPYGHRWSIATHKEDLSGDEIEKRGLAVMEQMSKATR